MDAEGGTLSSTGLYWTDKEGKITISGISGTVVVTEVETIPGYTIDENTRTQTVVEMSRNVQSGNTQNLKSSAASDQAAVCACAHSRYFTGGSPSGLRV